MHIYTNLLKTIFSMENFKNIFFHTFGLFFPMNKDGIFFAKKR